MLPRTTLHSNRRPTTHPSLLGSRFQMELTGANERGRHARYMQAWAAFLIGGHLYTAERTFVNQCPMVADPCAPPLAHLASESLTFLRLRRKRLGISLGLISVCYRLVRWCLGNRVLVRHYLPSLPNYLVLPPGLSLLRLRGKRFWILLGLVSPILHRFRR